MIYVLKEYKIKTENGTGTMTTAKKGVFVFYQAELTFGERE